MTYLEAARTFLRGTKGADYLRSCLFLSHMNPEVDDSILEKKTWAIVDDTIWMERLKRLAVELVDTHPGT